MKKINLQQVAPAEIEARSMEIIEQELSDMEALCKDSQMPYPTEQLPILK